MTLKPSYLSFSAAKRLALFSPLLCLLLLTACAPQQSGLQHHQYSIVRYQDSLTALHDYRPPTREALSYTARRELQTAGAAVSQNGSNVRFTPIPDEEFDDGDIEVTPELLKEPSLYPALSLIQPIKETIRVTSSFGPRKHPVKRRRLMHAGVDRRKPRGKSRCFRARQSRVQRPQRLLWSDHRHRCRKRRHPALCPSGQTRSPERPEGQARPVYRQSRQDRAGYGPSPAL